VIDMSMDMLSWLRKQLEDADTDLLRQMVATFAESLMSADADTVCGAPYRESSPDRVNRRNGYRTRRWDTRVGSIDLRIPKLREGSYFPDWLLDARTRAERAFIAVVAEAYVRGVSTRRVEGLAKTLGITSLSKSQVSALASDLDVMVDEFRSRPLDGGPYTYVWVDALAIKVREGGRIVNVACLVAVGVNAEGHREILGTDITTTEDGAGWNQFLRDLVDRGLSGVQVVISDDHAGLVAAIESVLAGVSWQRCLTHYVWNLRGKVPASSGRRPVGRCRVPSRGRSPRRSRRRDPHLHRVPQSPLAPNLVEQSPRTVEQRDPPSHQRSGDLPHPGIDHPPRRCRSRRTARRMGHRPPVYEPRRTRPSPHPTHRNQPAPRGGDPDTRNRNRLERRQRGRHGITHTPHPRT